MAVCADVCLEQTIVSKIGASSIIGNTKKKQFVAVWEMIPHEMLAVVHRQREVSGIESANTQLLVNHEFNKAATLATEENIKGVIRYIKDHENPAVVKPEGSGGEKLQTIFTQEVVAAEVSSLLNFASNSTILYETHRTDTFVTRRDLF